MSEQSNEIGQAETSGTQDRGAGEEAARRYRKARDYALWGTPENAEEEQAWVLEGPRDALEIGAMAWFFMGQAGWVDKVVAEGKLPAVARGPLKAMCLAAHKVFEAIEAWDGGDETRRACLAYNPFLGFMIYESENDKSEMYLIPTRTGDPAGVWWRALRAHL